MVADELLMPAGRTVRCGSCSHQWLAVPSGNASAAVAAQEASLAIPTPEAANPTVTPTVPAAPSFVQKFLLKINALPVLPFKIAVPVLALIWAVIAFFAYAPHGNKTSEGLSFSEVRMEPKAEGEKTSFVISGSIVNHAPDERNIPSVRVALQKRDGSQFWTREYPVNKPLAAGEVYPFKIANVETAFADDVQHVIVDMGSSMQLMVR
jgi:hypothetical protein